MLDKCKVLICIMPKTVYYLLCRVSEMLILTSSHTGPAIQILPFNMRGLYVLHIQEMHCKLLCDACVLHVFSHAQVIPISQ